jgi:hypothetical protein
VSNEPLKKGNRLVPEDYHNLRPDKRHTDHRLGGPEIDDATIAFFAEQIVAPVVVPAVLRAAQGVADTFPESPSGGFVPWRNRRVFVTARRTYRGDVSARDKFADLLGMNALSSEHLLALPELLSPTFDPKRPDSRTEWELMRSDEAIRALVNRWETLARGEKEDLYGWGAKSVRPYLVDPLDDYDPRGALEPDLRLVFLRERVHSSLDDRRLAEVALMHAAEFDWERPSETTRMVSESLDMHPRTVRRYRERVRNHPEFRREFGRAL